MLPLALRNMFESGNGVLFLGAGIGFAAHRDGQHMPTATELAVRMAAHFGVDAGGSQDLSKIAQIVELRRGRKNLQAFLTEQLADFEPDHSLRWLLGRTWRAIFTTNYDRVIERAYELEANPKQNPVTISSTSASRTYNPHFEVPIYHIHGALFDTSSPHVLITQNDYAQFREVTCPPFMYQPL